MTLAAGDIQGRSILVVDDEESLRLTFELFLKREGYGPVVVAASFEEALSSIDRHDFDLIISDIVLEGASGIEFLRQVRARGFTCPVVMITGYPNVKTASEAVRLGAFDYIPKPVTKDALLRTTRLALQQRSLQKEKEAAEAERERVRHYLETIFRSVRDAIVTVDLDLRIVELNIAARRCLMDFMPELPPGALIGALPGSLGTACLNDAEKVIKTRQDVPEHRVECLKPDGSQRVLSVSAAPLEDGRGNFLGAVLVARDMTRLDELERRGQRLRFHRMIGRSPAMQMVYTLIENVGKVDTTVLITGESGTGKELVADALHAESPRRNRPLVKVDCTAIPEDLLESELFGHKKGAFTGAEQDRMGRILQADGGTLFLDEIGDISPRTQLRLLRFLQERTFYPVGRDQPIRVDVRLVAATNADLKKKVQRGEFREDLYFRLRVVDVMLPPLRERKEDVPQLVEHFRRRFQEMLGKEITGVSDQALECLENYQWPGNVRELEHVIERACVLCPGPTISTEHLPPEVCSAAACPVDLPPQEAPAEPSSAVPVFDTGPEMGEVERILHALRKTGGNKAKAARLLGIDRSTLYRKIKENRIDASAVAVE